MIIPAVLLILIVLIFLYLFFAPFYLEINSAKELYRIRFHHLFSISLKIKENVVIETSILGWKHESGLKGPTEDAAIEPKRNKPAEYRQIPIKRLLRIASSFKINKCYINLDFGDMQLNGIVYPIFGWLSWYSKRPIQVNFTGRNVIILEVENSLARMSRAWLGSNQ